MSQYKIVVGYRMLAGEFCVVNGEFSNLWSMPNEHPGLLIKQWSQLSLL